jgi:hypothetical protein
MCQSINKNILANCIILNIYVMFNAMQIGIMVNISTIRHKIDYSQSE